MLLLPHELAGFRVIRGHRFRVRRTHVLGSLWTLGNIRKVAKRFGVLLASGLIVGESLLGVLTAGLIVASGKATPLALVGDSFAGPAQWIGMLMLVVVVFACYRWVAKQSEIPVEASQ